MINPLALQSSLCCHFEWHPFCEERHDCSPVDPVSIDFLTRNLFSFCRSLPGCIPLVALSDCCGYGYLVVQRCVSASLPSLSTVCCKANLSLFFPCMHPHLKNTSSFLQYCDLKPFFCLFFYLPVTWSFFGNLHILQNWSFKTKTADLWHTDQLFQHLYFSQWRNLFFFIIYVFLLVVKESEKNEILFFFWTI